MELIPAYTSYIDQELKKLQLPSSPKELYDPLRYFLQIGGKRMRAILTLLGAELFGLEKEQAVNAALAIELFHNFTLIHDDIMDNAPLRRGYETVHTKWNRNVAILSGDALMVKAYEQLAQQKGDLRQLISTFNRIAFEVCEGQQIDMNYECQSTISVEEYIEMIRLKTSVLLGGALEMAAIIAETSPENKTHIFNYGVNVGLAFQIQDDLLDLYADPKKFGKQVGGDVVANKKTILFLLAQQHANENQINQLNALATMDDAPEKIKLTRQLFDELNVKQKSSDLIQYYFDCAQYEMNKIDVASSNKEKLTQLSTYLLNREV